MIRIGILDEEVQYVGKLAAYLNRENKGAIKCSAFTEEEKLVDYMEKNGLDVVVATKGKALEHMAEQFQKVCCIELAEERKKGRFPCIYRYQSGERIAKEINGILNCEGLYAARDRPAVAIYSPIGRCGKTKMALDFVRAREERRWIYIGLEDYGIHPVDGINDWLYYVKERKEEKIVEIIDRSEGLLASPFSPFDTKLLDRTDMEWLISILKKSKQYQGILFDIGTGVLKDITILTLFDRVLVPCLYSGASVKKKERFEEVARAYGLNDWIRDVVFLDMEQEVSLQALLE